MKKGTIIIIGDYIYRYVGMWLCYLVLVPETENDDKVLTFRESEMQELIDSGLLQIKED